MVLFFFCFLFSLLTCLSILVFVLNEKFPDCISEEQFKEFDCPCIRWHHSSRTRGVTSEELKLNQVPLLLPYKRLFIHRCDDGKKNTTGLLCMCLSVALLDELLQWLMLKSSPSFYMKVKKAVLLSDCNAGGARWCVRRCYAMTRQTNEVVRTKQTQRLHLTFLCYSNCCLPLLTATTSLVAPKQGLSSSHSGLHDMLILVDAISVETSTDLKYAPFAP